MISNSILTRTSKPFRALTRRQREDLSDALYKHRCRERAYHCALVDMETEEPLPDVEAHVLVVLASTDLEAKHTWERYALSAGVTGRRRLAMTVTEPAKGRQRERERLLGTVIDFDALQLEDELDEIAAAERVLGL